MRIWEAFYAQERHGGSRGYARLHRREKIPGGGRARPNIPVLYEFTSLEAREENYIALEETEWTKRVHGYLAHPPARLCGKPHLAAAVQVKAVVNVTR